MATLAEITEGLKNLATARLHYLEEPEDAGDFDSATIAADLKTGILAAMKDGLAMAAEMVSTSNDDSLDIPSDSRTGLSSGWELPRLEAERPGPAGPTSAQPCLPPARG